MGVCTWEKCPRIRDSVRLARDTAIFRFQPAGHIRGPDEPILRPTDTVSGPHGSEHGQKETQTVPKLILSINLGNGTFWGGPRRHRGPFLVSCGRVGPGHGHSGARGASAADTRAFRVPKAIVCHPSTTPALCRGAPPPRSRSRSRSLRVQGLGLFRNQLRGQQIANQPQATPQAPNG